MRSYATSGTAAAGRAGQCRGVHGAQQAVQGVDHVCESTCLALGGRLGVVDVGHSGCLWTAAAVSSGHLAAGDDTFLGFYRTVILF